MADFKKVQHPTEASSLTEVNQTVPGAAHPVAQNFVDKVIKNTVRKNLRVKETDVRDFMEGRPDLGTISGPAFGTKPHGFLLQNPIGGTSALMRRRMGN